LLSVLFLFFFFFFSSRRRHTRWPRDWSSDVCSSDLHPVPAGDEVRVVQDRLQERDVRGDTPDAELGDRAAGTGDGDGEVAAATRSEERRVGKEGRSRGWRDQ